MRRLVFVALLLCLAAVRVQADPADSLISQGAMLLKAGQTDMAIGAFKKATEISPKNPIAHNNLGFALEKKGLLDLAMASYLNALKIKPDYKDARDNLVHAAVAKAAKQIDGGQAGEARDLMLQVVGQLPDAAVAHYHLGLAYKELGDDAQALAAWQKAAQLVPTSAIASYVEGMQKMASGDFQGALGDFDQAIKRKKDNAYAHNARGLALARSNNLPGALAAFQQAVKLRPGYAAAWVNVAEVQAAMGNLPAAQQSLNKAIAANPKSPYPHLKLAQALYTLGRFAEAEKAARQSVKLKGDFAPSRLQLGLILSRLQRYGEALAEFQAGVKANPNDISCHYAMGLLFVAGGKMPEATAAFQEVVRIGPPTHPYAADAQARLQAMTALPPTPPPPGTPPPPPPPPVAAATRACVLGPITLQVPVSFQEGPTSDPTGQQYLASFARLDGAQIWVYKPQKVPGGASLKQVGKFAANEARKLGFTEKEEIQASFGGNNAIRYRFEGAETFYLYVTVAKGQAYVVRAHCGPSDLPTMEQVVSTAVIP